jgi:hypothetical protein
VFHISDLLLNRTSVIDHNTATSLTIRRAFSAELNVDTSFNHCAVCRLNSRECACNALASYKEDKIQVALAHDIIFPFRTKKRLGSNRFDLFLVYKDLRNAFVHTCKKRL